MSFEGQSYLAPYTVAQELDVSESQVRRWIDKGELPTVRIERFIRIPVEGYQAFLRRKVEQPA